MGSHAVDEISDDPAGPHFVGATEPRAKSRSWLLFAALIVVGGVHQHAAARQSQDIYLNCTAKHQKHYFLIEAAGNNTALYDLFGYRGDPMQPYCISKKPPFWRCSSMITADGYNFTVFRAKDIVDSQNSSESAYFDRHTGAFRLSAYGPVFTSDASGSSWEIEGVCVVAPSDPRPVRPATKF